MKELASCLSSLYNNTEPQSKSTKWPKVFLSFISLLLFLKYILYQFNLGRWKFFVCLDISKLLQVNIDAIYKNVGYLVVLFKESNIW